MKFLTRTVWIISLISLFTDMASEMLYPVMPVYLRSIGFSIALIGILEGFSEAIAGFSKGFFGKMSDSSGRRVPFVRIGYALSAISKPLIGMFTAPAWIFTSRSLDRMGKGVRTAARDAMLSDECNTESKGRVFGFHRSMDTFGAVLGPLGALLYLHYNPGEYRALFFIAFAPGVVAILLSWMMKDKHSHEPAKKQNLREAFSFLSYLKKSPPEYRKLLYGLLAFTLFNSSDVFLLLRMKDAGMSEQYVIAMYVLYNLVFAVCAFPVGILGDRVGLKKVFIGGLVVFSAVYAGMGYASSLLYLAILYGFYGLYAAATEGVSKAWITNISEKKDTATAVGTYMSLNSICVLLASSMAGLVWEAAGAQTMFLMSGGAALIVAAYLATRTFREREAT